jgi:hypothetical protein
MRAALVLYHVEHDSLPHDGEGFEHRQRQHEPVDAAHVLPLAAQQRDQPRARDAAEEHKHGLCVCKGDMA